MDLKSLAFADEPKATYPAEEDPVGSSIYRAPNIGRLLPNKLELNYFSPITLINDSIEIDSYFNVSADGTVNPTFGLLEGLELDFKLRGKEIFVEKTFTASQQLRNTFPKPFTLDEAYLTIGVSTAVGPYAAGGINFSIPKVGKGEVIASGTKKGFKLNGSFEFDSESIDSKISVEYDNRKAKEGGDERSSINPWSVRGNLNLKKGKVKGVNRASLRITYENNILSGDGRIQLAVTKGVEGTEISFEYNTMSSSLVFKISARLVGIPGIENTDITAIISSGDDEGSGDEFSFKINADIDLKFNIPILKQLESHPKISL